VRKAKWLQTALDGGHPFSNLHLAHLTFYAGQEDAALAHLKQHLSWCLLFLKFDRYVLNIRGSIIADPAGEAHVHTHPLVRVFQV
jgi:hypothetical protein